MSRLDRKGYPLCWRGCYSGRTSSWQGNRLQVFPTLTLWTLRCRFLKQNNNFRLVLQSRMIYHKVYCLSLSVSLWLTNSEATDAQCSCIILWSPFFFVFVFVFVFVLFFVCFVFAFYAAVISFKLNNPWWLFQMVSNLMKIWISMCQTCVAFMLNVYSTNQLPGMFN